MMTKKLFLWGVLGVATLFSTTSFAFHHSHHYRPRIQHNHHHHHNPWRSFRFHHWEPHRNQVIVRSGPSYGHVHRHY
jgi:hypothetical protein